MAGKYPVAPEVTAAQERYLSAPLIVDPEYVRLYTEAHRELAGTLTHPIELRAECHARALEHMPALVLPDELILGHKTRYTRGAIPYCNYASNYVLREIAKVQQEEQDSVTEVGTGGGIQKGKELAAANPGEFTTFGKKFLIRKDDLPTLQQCAQYWSGKCMQDVGDRLWKTAFDQAEYIEKGWKAVMYTAAHDPAPEGRNILDFETALGRGLEAIAEDAEQRAKHVSVENLHQTESIYFWRAAARVLRATIAWSHNYANEARRVANTDPSVTPQQKERLLALADMCEHVPAKPPRSFTEAVQAYWLIYLAGHIEGSYMGYSPGRFDQYMFPYFENEFKSGKLPRQTALDLLAMLRMKHTEIEYVASFSWEGLGSGNMFQNMILGGLMEDGRPADNELSVLVCESAMACRTTQPSLSVWYDERLSHRFLMKAAECVKTGVGFPAWFNFKCYAQHELEASGLTISVIRKYAAMGGCTEPTLGGMSYGIVQAGFINLCKVFELALHGGVDPRTGVVFERTPIPKTIEELMAAFEQHLERTVRNWQRYWNYVMAAHRQTCVLVYASALTRDCIGRGLSLDDGGAVNNGTPTTLSSGMVNVANSFAAVKELVEVEKACTMEELRAALLANWDKTPELLLRAKRAPKWGNDDDRADQFYVRLFDSYVRIVREQKNYLGKPYDPSMLAISTHAPFGKACYATPDGRVCGETLADGVTSPFPGTDVSGPFSVLLSAAKIDHTRIRGGLHNMKLHPASLRGAAGSRKLLGLIASYFKSSSAYQIQFNVVDSATLIDAQANPHKYRDLIVRVAGFSAYFVELAKPIQDEVIARTEHTLGGTESAGDHASVALAVGQREEEADLDGDENAEMPLGAVEGRVFDVQDFTLHDGPGVRTTVFLKGCPLRCAWCCNPEGQSFAVEELASAIEGEEARTAGRMYKASELVTHLLQRAHFFTAGGGVTLSGGEPLAQPRFATAVARLLVRRGVSLAIETSGAWRWDEVRDAVRCASLVYFDLKAAGPEHHKKVTGMDNAAILVNLAHVVRELGPERVVVSVPVVPGVNDSVEEIHNIAVLAKDAGARSMRLLPYHALGVHKYKALCREYPMGEVPGRVVPEQLLAFKEAITALGMECKVITNF